MLLLRFGGASAGCLWHRDRSDLFPIVQLTVPIDLDSVQVPSTGLVKPDDPDPKIWLSAAEALDGV